MFLLKFQLSYIFIRTVMSFSIFHSENSSLLLYIDNFNSAKLYGKQKNYSNNITNVILLKIRFKSISRLTKHKIQSKLMLKRHQSHLLIHFPASYFVQVVRHTELHPKCSGRLQTADNCSMHCNRKVDFVSPI